MFKKIVPFISIFIGLAVCGFSETAYIYKDVSILESALSQSSFFTVPFSAYDYDFQPSSIRVINTTDTNIYLPGAKAYLPVYAALTNAYQAMLKEKTKLDEDLSRLTIQNTLYEKLSLTLAQNTSLKFADTLDKYFNAYKNNQTIIDELKSKIKKQNEEIALKKNEMAVHEKMIAPFKIPMKVLTFNSNVTGIIHYKINSGWQPKYAINLDNKTFALDINLNPVESLSIPIEQSMVFSFYWKPSIRTMDLKKLSLYLSTPYVYNNKLNMQMKKNMQAPAAYKQEQQMDAMADEESYGRNSQMRPDLVEETSDVGIVWNIDKPFTLERDSLIGILKNTPIDIKQTYYTIPSQSLWGYSVIEVSNVSEVYILPGEASLLSKNTEVPEMQITVPIAPGSSYQFQGIETKSIQAERKVIRDFKETPQLFRGTTIQTKEFQIQVKNGVNKEIEMNLLDRLPIPTDNRIILKNLFVTDKTEAELKDCLSNKSGQLTWKFPMKPNEKKTIKIKYSLEYPGEMNLSEREE